jgi:hypothetical protein
MSHNGKRLKQTAMRRARKRVRNEKQIAKDKKAWACGRKKIYTKDEAEQKAIEIGQTAYLCPYGDHFHTTHQASSPRFNRSGVAA